MDDDLRNAYDRIAKLEDELSLIREQKIQLENLIKGETGFPLSWGLGQSESRILELLMARRSCTRAVLTEYVYHDREEPASDTLISVFVSRIRQKLQKFDVSVMSKRGAYSPGYWLSPDDKRRLSAAMQAEDDDASQVETLQHRDQN